MAYAYHHHGKWFACWKDARGKWRRTATLARTKTDAKRLAVELEGQGERQRKGLEPLPPEVLRGGLIHGPAIRVIDGHRVGVD
jgi:hypothetical protein